MADQLLPIKIILRDTDAAGTPLGGGSAYFVSAGTTTAVTVYSDSGLTTALANPVTADSTGAIPPVWFGTAGSVDAYIYDSTGAQKAFLEDIPRYSNTGSAASSIGVTPGDHISATNVQAALEANASELSAEEARSASGIAKAARYAAYSGTANAISLTSGAGHTALTTGMTFRFRAAVTNTAATSINLDGLGAVACATVTGAALSADYIRTDIDTVASYDGTTWIVDRAPETGSDANGSWERMANGIQRCWHSFDDSAAGWTTVSGSLFRRDTNVNVTYPKTFSSVPVLIANAIRNDGTVVGCSQMAVLSGSAALQPWASTSLAAASTKVVTYLAEGRWYA